VDAQAGLLREEEEGGGRDEWAGAGEEGLEAESDGDGAEEQEGVALKVSAHGAHVGGAETRRGGEADVAEKEDDEAVLSGDGEGDENSERRAEGGGEVRVGAGTENEELAMNFERTREETRSLALEQAAESDAERGMRLHRRCAALTADLTGELVEQLRLMLQPTAASRLTGDYKSGKRLNMKRVIAYIASGFRQDKIWMRRTKPDRREYHIVLAIDETRSMQVR
jgi:midasin